MYFSVAEELHSSITLLVSSIDGVLHRYYWAYHNRLACQLARNWDRLYVAMFWVQTKNQFTIIRAVDLRVRGTRHRINGLSVATVQLSALLFEQSRDCSCLVLLSLVFPSLSSSSSLSSFLLFIRFFFSSSSSSPFPLSSPLPSPTFTGLITLAKHYLTACICIVVIFFYRFPLFLLCLVGSNLYITFCLNRFSFFFFFFSPSLILCMSSSCVCLQ